ncbi:MAG TPA: hypothetical protein VEK76_06700 [Candidatus Binatia bacterium]|nr:hypothetical protein [Candidatus Binatia bacterium]
MAAEAADRQPSPQVTVPATAPAAAPAHPVPHEEGPGRRRVERLTPAGQGQASASEGSLRQQRQAAQRTRAWSAASMVAPLDSDDPAIPFDRVPYVPADLRRVAIIAGLMVILILIAWAVVTHVVSS